ncbi:DoxX family protein [Gordonia sp. DT218]|uniref:DoxX family protein n=1 Tax=unclassified Gordonia (in: high G+C Gram-positive bacteria) TaxID=2657482 RepID=UPI003CF0FF23
MTDTHRVAGLTLGAVLATAGIGHMTFQREEFQAQVPDFVPLGADATVLASGVAEVGLGLGLIGLPKQRRALGALAAAFFVAVFPGNIHQYRNKIDAFGLDSDRKRLIRLFGQPALVALALYARG